MSKKKNRKRNKHSEESDIDIGFNMIYNPPDDGDWGEWVIENNLRFTSDVTLYDYQIFRRLLLRGSGYVLNDIAKAPEYSSNPDFFGHGLSLNEHRWYRPYDDEGKYTLDYRYRKRYISNFSQYLQRREVTNLDKFQIHLDGMHLRRMTLFYGIQLFDECGNMIFAAMLYTEANERHILVNQYFIDPSKRLEVCNVIPSDAVIKTKSIIYWNDYPRFSVCSNTEGLCLRSFTNEDGNIIVITEDLPYKGQ